MRRGGAARKTAPAAPSLVDQLEAHAERLRRRHPELIGIGLGQRTRRGRVVGEAVVKLQVARKRKQGSPGLRAFPRALGLRVNVLSHVVTIRMPTDVETPRRARPTSFGVGAMRAAALASWTDVAGERRHGVVTAAHGLPSPGDADPFVAVETSEGKSAWGTVVARADLSEGGYDIGLVRLEAPRARLPDITQRRPRLAGADELLTLLSSSATDDVGAAGLSWGRQPALKLRALAFLVEWRVAGFAGALRRVVQVRGAANSFKPGTSGSCWVTDSDGDQVALAVQSRAVPPSFIDAYGTHLLSGVEWLQQQPGVRDLHVAWRVADLP